MQRVFTKQFLKGVLTQDIDDAEIISDEIVDTRRWSVEHELVFRFENKFYRTYYSVGATEMQDESPFEYDDDEISCTEVHPVQVITVEYVDV